jgi:hypothetical protein
MKTIVLIRKELHETGIPQLLRQRLRKLATFRDISGDGDHMYVLPFTAEPNQRPLEDQLLDLLQLLGAAHAPNYRVIRVLGPDSIAVHGGWDTHPWFGSVATCAVISVTTSRGHVVDICSGMRTPTNVLGSEIEDAAD